MQTSRSSSRQIPFLSTTHLPLLLFLCFPLLLHLFPPLLPKILPFLTLRISPSQSLAVNILCTNFFSAVNNSTHSISESWVLAIVLPLIPLPSRQLTPTHPTMSRNCVNLTNLFQRPAYSSVMPINQC